MTLYVDNYVNINVNVNVSVGVRVSVSVNFSVSVTMGQYVPQASECKQIVSGQKHLLYVVVPGFQGSTVRNTSVTEAIIFPRNFDYFCHNIQYTKWGVPSCYYYYSCSVRLREPPPEF